MILKVLHSCTKATIYLLELDRPFTGMNSSTIRLFIIKNRILHNDLKDISNKNELEIGSVKIIHCFLYHNYQLFQSIRLVVCDHLLGSFELFCMMLANSMCVSYVGEFEKVNTCMR